jgi:predicted transglutaminase-like cysteine proteinase
MSVFLRSGRAKRLGLLVGTALAASAPATAKPRTAPAAEQQADNSSTPPLRFFTIAGRVAELRRSGALPGAASAEPAEPTGLMSAGFDPSTGTARPQTRDEPQTADGLFLGATALPVPDGDLFGKWTGMERRWQAEQAIIAGCASGSCHHSGARKWIALLGEATELGGLARLEHVNSAVNRSIAYATDFQIYGVADHWASPLQSLERAGDCEDYAIAKYWLLRATGIATDDLRLVALRMPSDQSYHAILAVRLGTDWHFLDNRRRDLTKQSDYAAMQPIATINESGQAMLVKPALARSN